MKGSRKLGLGSGVGLVVADMVGTGVLTTAGFMVFSMSPKVILLDWVVGGLVALAGALAYAAVARQVPRSGGEYRYLSTLVHPSVGYLAGWTSLLVGFSMPIAVAALGAGAFASTLLDVDVKWTAVTIIALITALHAVNFQASKWAQNALVVVKGLILVAFIAIGLVKGTNHLPDWNPSAGHGFPTRPFFESLVYISFCYSGWNAATYASDEFDNPRRNVPRAMIIGCALVAGLYLLVNWVFVTNLTHDEMANWVGGDTARITLAHLVFTRLIGAGAAKVMSIMIVLALMSAISAMTLIGPRVYAAMAKDGFLPRALTSREGRPPLGSVIMQSGLACVIVFASQFHEVLNNVGAILAIVSALTALSLFRVQFRKGPVAERPGIVPLAAAVVFASLSGYMVYFAIKGASSVALIGNDPPKFYNFGGLEIPRMVVWMLGVLLVSIIGYITTKVLRPNAGFSEMSGQFPATTADDRRSAA
jgi:APA family basic amino acid/polyamine antiporter